MTYQQIRSDVAGSLPHWLLAGGSQRVLQEWDNLLENQKVAPAFREIAQEREMFVDFFTELASVEEASDGPKLDPRRLDRMFDGDEGLWRGIVQMNGNCVAVMAAQLLLKFRS